jgi:adenosylcobinamide kinase/adenosylcobinamide-phosphate guanylyltransferase
MKKIVLVIGGCKSGKSRYALERVDRLAVRHKIFIATSVPFDDEMKDRIDRHRDERGSDWETVEAPDRLADAIQSNSGDDRGLLVDCLTLWINNLLMASTDEKVLQPRVTELAETLEQVDGPIYLVSNEVGAGIVPQNPLARQFRDLAGSVNQAIASMADEVVWLVAGIPVKIK